jgi:hypothetical protein
MIDIKKIDIKLVFIGVLSIGLIISFFFGQRSNIDYKKSKIKSLEAQNTLISKKNDSLLLVNKILDTKFVVLQKEIEITTTKIELIQSKLDSIKNRKNEIPNSVNRLSANGVADGITKYLENNTKSADTRK